MYFYDDERLTVFEVGIKKPIALFTDKSSFWDFVNKINALPLFNKESFYKLHYGDLINV